MSVGAGVSETLDDTGSTVELEPIIDPDLPIVDAHHHLWDRLSLPDPTDDDAFLKAISRHKRYLLHEFLADTSSGHNVRASVFIQCHAMYRADGPEEFRCIGETEFVNGVAAMSASGLFGDARICAGIVGGTDLRLGTRVAKVLEAHIAAGGGRFRGVRQGSAHDPDEGVLGSMSKRFSPGLYLDAKFREGLVELERAGLSFDAWLLEPQIPDLIDLSHAYPDMPIVLCHVGTPLGIARYKGKREERFHIWRENIRALAKSENVHVKLGGLAMPLCGFDSFLASPPATSEQLAAEWKPYIETCIDAFGPARCMFESNFPTDKTNYTYAVLWNAFKRLAKDFTKDEKHALFSGTAIKFYRLAC